MEGKGVVMQFYRLAKVLPGPQNLAFVLGGADFWGAKRTALKIVLAHTPYQCLHSIQGIFWSSTTDSQLSSCQEGVCGVPLELPSVELCPLWVIEKAGGIIHFCVYVLISVDLCLLCPSIGPWY